MIEAELPDGTILEFPDGTAPDVMQRVVKQRIGQAPKQEKSMLGALGGAIGQGVGNVALGAQNLVGMGLEKLGADQAGQWLQKDAAQGKAKLQGEIQPYEEQYPMTVGGGRLAGEVIGTLPVGGALAKGVGMAAKGVGAAKYASPLVDALRTGGMSAGAQTGAKALATRVAGGAATGGASAALLNPEEAGTGAMIGGAIPVAGAVLTGAKKIISPERLMQSALKPTLAQQQSGEAKAAVDTLLKYGINATQSGADKLKNMVQGVDQEISDLISGSSAQISRNDVLGTLGGVRSKFASQVAPEGDLSAIQKVGDEFSNHPLFAGYGAEKAAAENAVQKALSEKQTALQAAGKLKTFAAQQKSLADGATIQLARAQPENQLYYNTGGMGRSATSSSSLPVPGYPRFPSRYTNNIDRVPEGLQGADEAMAIYAAKKLEQDNAEKALASLVEGGPKLSVQDAQRLKQGTYKVLDKKYGQLGSAETEAQKGLARGLKEQIALAVPEVSPLNAKQSELIKALKVTSRRAMMDDNRNPVGIAGLSTNPSQLAAMLADRSALLKSLAARGVKAVTPEENNALINALREGVYRVSPVASVD